MSNNELICIIYLLRVCWLRRTPLPRGRRWGTDWTRWRGHSGSWLNNRTSSYLSFNITPLNCPDFPIYSTKCGGNEILRGIFPLVSRFSSTFRVISRKSGLLFGQCTMYNNIIDSPCLYTNYQEILYKDLSIQIRILLQSS